LVAIATFRTDIRLQRDSNVTTLTMGLTAISITLSASTRVARRCADNDGRCVTRTELNRSRSGPT